MKPENVEAVDDDIDSWNQWKKRDWNNQYENREPIRWLD
jgi:hypothetical protein